MGKMVTGTSFTTSSSTDGRFDSTSLGPIAVVGRVQAHYNDMAMEGNSESRSPTRGALMVKTRVACALVVSLLVACAPSGANEQQRTRTFSISSDPEAMVLRLSSQGGMTGSQVVRTIYGNGRLAVLDLGHDGKTILKSTSIRLSREEVEALISRAVEGRLLEMDQRALMRARAEEVEAVPFDEDGAMVYLEAWVTDLRVDGESLGPRSTRLGIHSPWWLAQVAPDFAPARAFVEILEAVFRAEREGSPSDPRKAQ